MSGYVRAKLAGGGILLYLGISTTIPCSTVRSSGHTIGNARAIIAIENRDILRTIGALPHRILLEMAVLENK